MYDKISSKSAALLAYLWSNRDASRADLHAAGFTPWIVTRASGGRDGSLPRWIQWDHRTGGYRLTRSGKSLARRQLYALVA